jgi:hypothetical protein
MPKWLHNTIWFVPVITIRAPIVTLAIICEATADFIEDYIYPHLPGLK